MQAFIIRFVFIAIVFMFSTEAMAIDRGLYLTQGTARNSKLLASLVSHAHKYKINTFVVDLKRPSKSYARAIAYLHKNHIKYVPRIVIFPGGAYSHHLLNSKRWQMKWSLMQYAIHLKAAAIQLDYIRYNTKRRATQKNVDDIVNVVRYFHQRIHGRVPLQVDVFGLVSFAPMREIGQDVRAMSPYIEAACPMVYPSHYSHPFHKPRNAYHIVYKSLIAMKKQLHGITGVKIYAYIEASSYRHSMSWSQRVRYMQDQINAVRKAKISGWYVWSPGNKYGVVYAALAR